MTVTAPPRTPRPPRRSTLVLTALLHLLVLWPYTASGLLAPGWAVVTLLVVWALLGVLAVAVHRRYGAVAALVPLLALGAWFAALTLGEAVLGWRG